MNRTELELLQSQRGHPALSILVPTHRTAPQDQEDPIRLKNLTAQATERLLAEFPRHEVEPLLARLDALIGQIDPRKTLDGLALYVNGDMSRLFYLPFAPGERFVIDESFAVRELLLALNASPRYWVLVLGNHATRLFEGWRDTLTLVGGDRFPIGNGGEPRDKPLPVGYGIEKSKQRAERDRQYLHEVDAALNAVAATHPHPLVVVGTERWLSGFRQVSRHADRVVATVTGNHARTPVHELAKLVWPLVQNPSISQDAPGK